MIERIALIVFLIFATSLLSGCTPITILPIVGASYEGYTVWKSGESKRYYSNDLETTYQAVKRSCEQLKLQPKIYNMGSQGGYSLDVRGNNPMEISVLPLGKNFTSIVIKIGLFDDKQYVEFFYRTIEQNIPSKNEAGDKEKSVPWKGGPL